MCGAPTAENGSAASARMQPRTFIKSMEASRSYTQRMATREITMKSLRWLWLCTLLACPSHKGPPDGGAIDAGPAQLSEHEPNDRPEEALAITESAVVHARVDGDPPKPDEDWDALTPAAARGAALLLCAIPAVSVAVGLHDVP